MRCRLLGKNVGVSKEVWLLSCAIRVWGPRSLGLVGRGALPALAFSNSHVESLRNLGASSAERSSRLQLQFV